LIHQSGSGGGKASGSACQMSDMDGWLPFPVISELILKCIAATGREDFPLVIGASARIHHWGIMGKLLSAAADLRSALVEFVGNHPRLRARRGRVSG
jgi:Arabinose-binding domain of AraC transcription regulator, N-term